jgi:hypothetical protein
MSQTASITDYRGLTTPVNRLKNLNGKVGMPGGLAGGWEIITTLDGWWGLRRPYSPAEGLDYLALHGDWAGPVKLVSKRGRIEQRVDYFLGSRVDGQDDPALDEVPAQDFQELASDLLNEELYSQPKSRVEGWQAPPPETLASLLAEAGLETAIDRDKNLRLTLKRRGCDGQVRIERGEGRLRFLLPLGHWADLDPVADKAMHSLASAANARSRLVRIAWLADASGRRCEAQVDLSGLPEALATKRCRQELWRDMLRLAVEGLELALRQLGLELPLLGDPRYRELAMSL